MESKWYETEAVIKFASPCNICVIGNTSRVKRFGQKSTFVGKVKFVGKVH